MQTIFVCVALVWLGLGFMGILHCKDVGGLNWWMLGFLLLVPFLPLVAKVCGLI